MPSCEATPKLFAAGRLSKPMSALLLAHNEAPRLAWELKHIQTVLQVDRAHVVMLARQGHLSTSDAAALLTALDSIRAGGASAFHPVPGFGSLVLQIERVLTAHVGEAVAGRLPTARSRLDQGATVRRIVDRAGALRVVRDLLSLQEVLTATAERYAHTPFLSYTHMQQAQPTTFGHYLLAFSERLDDAFQQLAGAYSRLDRSPLGAVGLSGTSFRIDRDLTARLLGFEAVLDNSRLGRDSYYQLELVGALAATMTLLNDLCCDLHVWASAECGAVAVDDSLCSTSSVFPQKKNPYALETVKIKAGESHGWVAAALAALRNEGTGDTNGRHVGGLDDACATTGDMMQLTAEVLRGTTVKVERCEELLGAAWVTANRLGNVLVTEHGFDYRGAHAVVARLVRNCLEAGVAKADVSVDMMRKAAAEMEETTEVRMTQEELLAALSHTEFLNSSISYGSPGPEQVKRLLVKATSTHRDGRAWLEDKTRRLEVADRELDAATEELQQSLAA